MPRLLWALAFCGTLFAGSQPPKTRLAEVQKIEPTAYEADLALDPAKNTFSGTIVIHLNVVEATDTLWLNQEKLHIESAVLREGTRQLRASIVPGGNNFVGLKFAVPLSTGAADATIRYTGTVEEKNSVRIFRQQEGGNWYLFTQFESTDARAAFPCFDEPSYKTPWKLTLRIPNGLSAVSNTPAESERAIGSVKTVVFSQTKPLPSYLVAFAVGPFEFVNAGAAGKAKVPVRIVVPRGKAAEARYAAEVTAEILTRLEDYFGIPFPYEKSDQVAIPNTLGWGAMENPGMVTYDQPLILAAPANDRINRQRNYAKVAAHELSHQWFGDLVTTAWWDDIWLNEGFATWMERKLIAEWKPEWNTSVEDVTYKLGAEHLDSLVAARKIRQEILTIDDINNAFDSITYEKGASVIGMFENWMGPEEFRKGVRSYLEHYRFRAVTAGDFLDSLSSSSGKNVTQAFSTFLNQAGVPLVSVKLNCSGAHPALDVEQTRFAPTGSKASADRNWSIPLCVRYGAGTASHQQCTLVSNTRQTVTLDAAEGCPSWVQANDRALGYYRVDYSAPLLKALVSPEVRRQLPDAERVDLLGNAQALSTAGKLTASDALGLVETFHDDPERNVTSTAISMALNPSTTLVPPDLLPNYQRFLLQNFGARARALGWTAKPGETDDTRLLRPTLLRAVATWGGDRELAEEARSLAAKWLKDRSAIDPNILNAVLGTAAFHGDLTLFNGFYEELGRTQDKQVRQSLISAMSSFHDRAAIEAGMRHVLSGDIPFIEGYGLLFSGQQEEATRSIPLDFLKANWAGLRVKMPTGGNFDIALVLPQAGAGYCDAVARDELKKFFAPKLSELPGAPRALDQVVESIDLCIANKAAQGPSVAEFLKRY